MTDSKKPSGLIRSRNFQYQVVFVVAVIILSAYFTQLRFTINHPSDRAPISSFLDNSANTPFQYRVLIPWIVQLLFKINFPFIRAPLNVFKGIEFISVFLLVFIFRYYLSLFFRNETVRSLLSLTIFYVLPFNYFMVKIYPVWYPSDIPGIAFFTLGLILMYRKKWVPYYLLFAVATFNRETTCFLAVIYLLTSLGKERLIKVFFHCLAQLVIWSVVKLFLYRLYVDNPGGGLFDTHVMFNLEYLADPRNYPYLFASVGFLWIPAFIFYGSIRDDFARRSLLVVIPFFIGMLFVGLVHELRIYGELIPVILAGLMLAARELYSMREKYI